MSATVTDGRLNDLSPDERAAIWCQRLAAGPLTRADGHAFRLWLDADPANAARLSEAEAIWDGAREVADTPEMIRYRVEAIELARRQGMHGAVEWRRWAALAACLILTLGLVGYLFADPVASYRTGVAERRVVQLDDGSRITLDGASQVDVRMDRGSRRLQLVAGRAKFDVAHDAMRPFSVVARDRTTVAIGTSFSVELLPRQVRVVLYEGSVEVTEQRAPASDLPSARTDQPIRLSPGRQLIASTESAAARVGAVDVQQSLTWEGGMLHFNREPLALAVARLNRDARVPLAIGDPGVGGLAISGAFDSRDAGAFVEGVTALYPVAAHREGDRIVLRSSQAR